MEKESMEDNCTVLDAVSPSYAFEGERTEADPILLADYIIALLKNNKSKKDLQKLCIEQLFDFLGEGTKDFVVKLFNTLEEGSILGCHGELEFIRPKNMPTAAAAMDALEEVQQHSSPPNERYVYSNIHSLSDQEGSDEEDNDRNHKHRRRATRSHSIDRDLRDEDIRGSYHRKRNRPLDIGHGSQDTDLSITESCPGSVFKSLSSEKDRRIIRDHGHAILSRRNVDTHQQQRGGRGLLSRINALGLRCETQNGPSCVIEAPGRGRGIGRGPWSANELRFDGAEPKPSLVWASRPPPTKVYSARAPASGCGNPSRTSWVPYEPFSGSWNTSLVEQSLPLNAGLQSGGRSTPISVNVNLGLGTTVGRLRCPDFEERGYCLQGDLCPMEHGANRIIVEDVQSLSKFNLPVTLPSSSAVRFCSGSLAAGASPSTTRGLSCKPVPETARQSLESRQPPSTSSGVLSSSLVGVKPDLYDPDQPLWDVDIPKVPAGMGRINSLGKGWESGQSNRRRASHVSDEVNSERHERVLGSPLLPISAHREIAKWVPSVWDRIGPVELADCQEERTKKSSSSLHETKSGGKESTGANVEEESNSIIPDNTARSIKTSENINSGLFAEEPTAQCTIFVNSIPHMDNKKELLIPHFRKFGEILDIKIPVNSNRAFVQFAHREDAAAALASPDAVMGNRFIRLSWAKRDNIPNPPQGKLPLRNINTGFSIGDAKDKLTCGSNAPSTRLENAIKPISANGHLQPSALPSQKKQEELEALKEELRQKQAKLDQKRDEFRRKLDQLSRQGTIARGEAESLQPYKRRKYEDVDESVEESSKIQTPITCSVDEAGLSSVKPTSVSSSKYSLTSPGVVQPSLKTPRSPFQRPVSITSGCMIQAQWGAARYKLDNRTSIFRVSPPFPDAIPDIAGLKDHFSKFGELVSVELEERQGLVSDSTMKLTDKSIVLVTFGSRRAAERAFVQGKWGQGFSLQLAWYTPPSTHVSPTTTTTTTTATITTPPTTTFSSVASSGQADVNKEGNVIETHKPAKENTEVEERGGETNSEP